MPDASSKEMSWAEFLALNLAGGIAGTASWASIYPIDVVKSRLQTQDLRHPQYRGMVHCAREIVRHEGARVLVRGLSATLLRAFPLNAVTISVYEWSLRELHKVPLWAP